MTTTTEAVEAVLFSDWCSSCVEGCGCGRWDTLTEPDEIHWDGPGTFVTATYQCPNGHQWRCAWSPLYLPLHGRTEGWSHARSER